MTKKSAILFLSSNQHKLNKLSQAQLRTDKQRYKHLCRNLQPPSALHLNPARNEHPTTSKLKLNFWRPTELNPPRQKREPGLSLANHPNPQAENIRKAIIGPKTGTKTLHKISGHSITAVFK